MDEDHCRTLNEINDVLHLAKLTEDDILPTSQTLFFDSQNFQNSDYKFLELDQNLHDELKLGQTLYIKGDDDESVVLCSDKLTYSVAVAETSNSLLLTKNLKFNEDLDSTSARTATSATVCGIFYEYLEATLTKPPLRKLTELLNKTVYKGPEHEYAINSGDLLSYEDLRDTIQASEKELKDVLKTMAVVTVDNKVRLLDFMYHFRVLSYMLKLIDENSWALDEIDYDETISALKEITPEEIVDSLFTKYAEESKIIDDNQMYAYKEDEVCKFFAQVLLYGAGKFNLDEFLQAWRESVPEGMTPDEELLYGVAIVDKKVRPNVISAYPEEALPEQINERFDALFKAKEKWTVPEITPYIQRLATDKLDVNALLAKHARASNVQGIKYYSAKHAK